jgi:hypothetical protein
MFLPVATLIAAASATASIGLAAPDAHADPVLDEQFLKMVHSNGVGGRDDTLIKYALEFCDSATGMQLPSRPDLYRQGVQPVQLYIVRMAAAHVYCPDKIAVPPIK